MRKAVVDVGSNSLILAVFAHDDGGWRPVFEATRVTGLGRGTKSTGLLADDRVTASLEALAELAGLARQQGATDWTACGTMALRIAHNSAAFLSAAHRQGTPVATISGETEARLGFLAVAEDPVFRECAHLAILDPGGHSTELTLATRTPEGWATQSAQSYPVGALGLRETCLRTPSPPSAERLAAVAEVDHLLRGVVAPDGPVEVVVLGATGTNLITIRERMETWQPEKVHGATLSYEEVSLSAARLCDLDDLGRAQVPGLERGRETTMHAGALILERFLFALRAEQCRVSVRGWRHALADHPELVAESRA